MTSHVLRTMYCEKRPWGEFHILDERPGFKVKRISVVPGGLSLQSHKQRIEHWTVVHGIATVTVGTELITLSRAQSVAIPLDVAHRLENRHADTLEIIEVQFGDYLGEDDVIRYDDAYHRT